MSLSRLRVAELIRQADSTAEDAATALLEMPEDQWKTFAKFLGLVEEEAVSGKGSWVKREDIEYHVQVLDQALNPTQARSALAKDPDLIDIVAQAIPVIQNARVDVMELNRLRQVYECSRRVLRYNGVDNDRVIEALNDLDLAVEKVKSFDAGTDPELVS